MLTPTHRHTHNTLHTAHTHYIHTNTYTRIQKHICKHACTHIYTPNTHTCIPTYTQTQTHTQTHTYTYAHMRRHHTHTHTHTHTHMHTHPHPHTYTNTLHTPKYTNTCKKVPYTCIIVINVSRNVSHFSFHLLNQKVKSFTLKKNYIYMYLSFTDHMHWIQPCSCALP